MWYVVRLVMLGLGSMLGLATLARGQDLPDQWQSFMSERNGGVFSVLARVNVEPILAAHPEGILIVSVAYTGQREFALPDQEEKARLDRLDGLFDQIEVKTRSPSLGRVTGQGVRTYFFLDRGGEKLSGALVTAAQSLGYLTQVHQDGDALARYRTDLAASPEEDRGIKDQMVLQQLDAAGDHADRARQVDHWAYFPSQDASDRFAIWATDHGFRVIDRGKIDGPLPFKVHTAHDGTVLPADILPRTLSQFRQAVELSGEYDGWETAVIR